LRIRFPVAAKMTLASAGITGGSAGSPSTSMIRFARLT
jgi:hypothetical protein